MSEMKGFTGLVRRNTAANIIINLIGAVAAGLYLEFINPLPSEQTVSGEFDLLSVAISTTFLIAVFGFFAGGLLSAHFLLPLILGG